MSIVPPLKLKAQLMCAEEPAIGPGKALVLEAIDRVGTISGAGRELGMSYRRIWLLVDSMNRCWSDRLVATQPGGQATRGAQLTDLGRRVLTSYRAMERRMEVAAREGDYADLIAQLRPTPLPISTGSET